MQLCGVKGGSVGSKSVEGESVGSKAVWMEAAHMHKNTDTETRG